MKHDEDKYHKILHKIDGELEHFRNYIEDKNLLFLNSIEFQKHVNSLILQKISKIINVTKILIG